MTLAILPLDQRSHVRAQQRIAQQVNALQVVADDEHVSLVPVRGCFNEQVYGGSDLVVVRGDFDRLTELVLASEVGTAIAQASTQRIR